MKPDQKKEKLKDIQTILKENKAIQEELTLAMNAALYIIVDLPNKVITLRAKGIILKEWSIKKIRLWGNPPPFKALTILRKTSMSVPQRIKIKPGDTEESGKAGSGGKFELEALEITDMPPTYTLIFEENVLIHIRPEPANLKARLSETGHFFNWYVGLPIKNLWLSLKKRPMTLIDIRLAGEKESKGLYWALTHKIKGFIAR